VRVLAASEMLDLWETGAARHPLDRAALMTAWARPDLPGDAVADLPLGTVTRALIELRAATFGREIAAHLDCANCGERLEVVLDAEELLEPVPAGGAEAAAHAVDVGGRRVRSPCLRDLAAIADEPDPVRAARTLMTRCTLSGDGTPVGDNELHAIEAALEALDPAADLAISMRCIACGRECLASLDIAALLWDEVAASARRLLEEVHRLALAYGWKEADVLALGPARRAAYLAMVGP
jgi:hypothetical protein